MNSKNSNNTKDSLKALSNLKNLGQSTRDQNNQNNQNNPNPFEITTLRLPIFCKTNKPFVFLKVLNLSEKYRVSVNPDFLKKYDLNFKILRDIPLNNFLKNLKLNQRKVLKFPEDLNLGVNNSKKDQAQIFLRLPDIEKLPVQKFTITLENDYAPGKTIVDKYEFHNIHNNGLRTTIFIIDRYYEDKVNSSISFISEEFLGSNGLLDFLDEYYSNF